MLLHSLHLQTIIQLGSHNGRCHKNTNLNINISSQLYFRTIMASVIYGYNTQGVPCDYLAVGIVRIVVLWIILYYFDTSYVSHRLLHVHGLHVYHPPKLWVTGSCRYW